MPAAIERLRESVEWWWWLVQLWRQDHVVAWRYLSHYAYARGVYLDRLAEWKAARPSLYRIVDEAEAAIRDDVVSKLQEEKDGTLWLVPNPPQAAERSATELVRHAIARLDEATAVMRAAAEAERPDALHDPRAN